jgi:hypothetical protein
MQNHQRHAQAEPTQRSELRAPVASPCWFADGLHPVTFLDRRCRSGHGVKRICQLQSERLGIGRPSQRDRPIACPLRSDCPMAGLTSMDSSGCLSALTLIACAGRHPHCRPGQRDRPIVRPLRRDWRCNAPAKNYRATNCSCASPDRKACDDSLNNPTRTAARPPCSAGRPYR